MKYSFTTNPKLYPPLGVLSFAELKKFFTFIFRKNNLILLFIGILYFTFNANAQTYCTPNYLIDCSYGDEISNVTLNGETTNINNSSFCSIDGYEDYTSLPSADLGIGGTYDITISTSYSSPQMENVAAWIDYNNDGIFESSEMIGYDPNGMIGGSSTYTFTVPTTAAPGDYRLRVRLVYNEYNSIDPCDAYDYGEAEDYTVTLFTMPDCSTADAGIISSDLTDVCDFDTYTLSSLGATSGVAGLTYQWQSSPTGVNTWTDIVNANNITYINSGLTDDTDYRLIVTCSYGSIADTSNIVTITAKPLITCFCVPVYLYDDYTTNFETIGAIENVNVSHTSNYSYLNYSDSDTITQMASLDLNFSHSYAWDYHTVAIWVDWNQNGVLENNELVFYEDATESPFISSFNIPHNTAPGNYRLRIRSYDYAPWSIDPCNIDFFGSATDFTLKVAPLPECSLVNTPPEWSLYSSLSTLCEIGDIILNISEPIIGSDISYIFQSSINGVNWSNLNTANTELSISINDIDETTQFRALWLCNGSVSDSTNAITILVTEAPELLTIEDGTNCGVGQVTMNASASSGAQIAWYDDMNSQYPIHIGNSYTTPTLNSDQTYYVSSFVGSAGSPQVFLGNGNIISNYDYLPFNTYYWGSKNQYLIRASELIDAGYTAGVIQEIIFDVVEASGLDMEDFTIKMGLTNNNNATSNFIQNLTTVYTSNTPETLTANTEKVFVLNNGFAWDGVSNLVIETCFNNSDWADGHSVRSSYLGFNATTSYNDDVSNVCDHNFGYTSYERPNIKLNILSGCQSDKEEIHALIHPDIHLNIATHQNLCVSSNHPAQLDAGLYSGNISYLWDDGSTGRYREVHQSGIYSITITNEFGCSSSADINVTIRQNPEVDLGPDIALCLGGSIELDAGPDGATYSWSNGATTRYNNITTPGTYTVLVAADNGCIVLDTIEITFSNQEIASFDAIQIQNLGSNTFKFEAINPQNITDYLWHFGDGNTSTTPIPTHTYDNNGNYTVKLDASNECGVVSDSIPTHIISIGENNQDKYKITLYPNPTNGKVIIKNETQLPMRQIIISDALGREIERIQIDHNSHQFMKEIDLSQLAEGMYWINIKNDKKSYSRKINLIK